MEEKLDKILSELQITNELQAEFTKGQKELTSRMENLETGQTELTEGQRELTKGQREMTSRMENLETGQTELTEGQRELTKGQREMTSRIENLETGQAELTEGQRELTKGQREMTSRMENLETGQTELTVRMEKGYEELKAGQAEIIDIIKHTTTLITENFTYVRKDMRTFQSDVNADIELLFNEVASVKRKVNKLEQSNK